ncbi:hypothetical protein J421_5479 (plasmid) [Gemmatirosa kalamazoonensis]|uniref:Methyltransferase type 11 n=1 Tax=Gemmatirosa kalamazoonensis TaxID=861299 RepID=W0RPT2_9BACT|nr:hypothetical protein [Gemmatirosa kalamazoonensis]AHG93014.1 hypothetical protein J421_5479 [Gemmatirosa kalamazoonensis]
MRRLQLFEIGELSGCPRAIRDGLTDYLAFMIVRGRAYAAAAPLLARAFGDGRTPVPIVDLASGAGGPWRALAPAMEELEVPVRVRLTDLHPNVRAYERLAAESGGVITGTPTPVSADAVPQTLAGVRTMFSAFHHFAPADARRVLADAATGRAPIAIFEATRRDARAILLTCLTPLFVLLATPFIRPFRWSRLFWTYVVPAIPLLVLFDGIVSCLRTYTPDELRSLAAETGADGYHWEAGEVGDGPIPVTYLLGAPR